LIVFCFLTVGCDSFGAADPHGAPAGRGWTPLVGSLDPADWDFEPAFWKIEADGALHGVSPGGAKHHFMYSRRDYADFELHADFKMIGYNSGICIRLEPVDFDNVPGYQVDMGDGYWGCLWPGKVFEINDLSCRIGIDQPPGPATAAGLY
jgi:hypothetical protein